MIPQDPTLFKGTLRFNIDPTEKVSEDDLLCLIEKAGLDKLLEKQLKDNQSILDLEIKEAGSNLSSGEKQLISICRAILRKAKVVVLDEATSNIDVLTEKKILKLLKEDLKESTVITIAHRLNTIINSDRIAVLGAGQLLEYGSPKELVSKEGSHFGALLDELKKD